MVGAGRTDEGSATHEGDCWCGVISKGKERLLFVRDVQEVVGQQHMVCVLKVLPREVESYLQSHDISLEV